MSWWVCARRTGIRPILTTVLLMVASLLLGCRQGYPADDAPQLDFEAMSQAQRMAHLNDTAAQAHPGLRWHYRLTATCALLAERQAKGQRHEQWRLLLADAVFTMGSARPMPLTTSPSILARDKTPW